MKVEEMSKVQERKDRTLKWYGHVVGIREHYEGRRAMGMEVKE